LILAGNQLQRIPLTVSLPKIAEIDLSRNQLKNFPDNLVNAFAAPASALKSFKLNNNPWNCDCGVASLGRWLVSPYN
jgi:Leucine-rich repeat (LRR) protein